MGTATEQELNKELKDIIANFNNALKVQIAQLDRKELIAQLDRVATEALIKQRDELKKACALMVKNSDAMIVERDEAEVELERVTAERDGLRAKLDVEWKQGIEISTRCGKAEERAEQAERAFKSLEAAKEESETGWADECHRSHLREAELEKHVAAMRSALTSISKGIGVVDGEAFVWAQEVARAALADSNPTVQSARCDVCGKLKE